MSFKFSAPSVPPNWCDETGLYYRTYSTYTGGSDSPDPSGLVSGSLTSTSGSTTSISTTSIDASSTKVWRGYFSPDETSSTWEFRVTSDDGAYLWLDSNAEEPVASLNTSNAIVDNSGVHGSPQTTTSTTLSLDSEYHYAITLMAGSDTGTGEVTLEWRRDGGAWSSAGTGRLCHDTRYVDGFGADLYTASASPATPVLWGIVGADGAIGYGSGTSPTSWTGYRHPSDASGNDHYDIAYGKDGSGNPLWVRTTQNNNYELAYSDDIEDSTTWTNVNVSGVRYNVKWSNDKWIAVGSTGNNDILTSSNGATWGSVDVTNLSLANRNITSLATDGGDNWIFGQNARVYASSNHGESWYLLHDFNDSSRIYEAAYSNNKWYLLRGLVGGAGVEKVAVATSANSGSWTDSADINLGVARAMFASVSTGSASQSTVIVAGSNDIRRSVDSGANFTSLNNVLSSGDARSIISDGNGNWVVTHDDGDISYSNDDGETWSSGANGLVFNAGTEDIDAVAVNKYLPL